MKKGFYYAMAGALVVAGIGLFGMRHKTRPPEKVQETQVAKEEPVQPSAPFMLFYGGLEVGRIARQSYLQRYDKEGNKSALEEEIEKAYPVNIKGEFNDAALINIKEALKKMPVVDECSVYVLPENTTPKELFGENGGLYEDAMLSYPSHILFWNTAPKTVTHEFAHKRASVLGAQFKQRWSKANKYSYGTGIKLTSTHVWEDGSRAMRWGFFEPYGRKSIDEDIATATAAVRHDLDALYALQLVMDEESADILTSKISLLLEGKLIHPAESDRAQRYLDQKRIKTDLETLASIRNSCSPERIRYGSSPVYRSGGIGVWAQKEGDTPVISVVYDPERKVVTKVNFIPRVINFVPVMRFDLSKDVPEKYRRFLPDHFIEWLQDVKKYAK